MIASMDITSVHLMVWNILEGWHDKDANGLLQWNENRFQASKCLIDQQQPDILVLNEALWARSIEGKFIDYAALLSYPFFCNEIYDGHWGNCILSRYPILSCSPFTIYNRSGLRVVIDTPNAPTHIATYHPHPSRYPENKASDYIELIEGHEHEAGILCGDFNAISPEDVIHESKIIKAFARFSENPAASFARFREGGKAIFPALKKLGFEDAIPAEHRRFTIPTDLLSLNKDSAMRIDHIWSNSKIKVHTGGVLQNSLADQSSDHYPTFLIFSSTP